MAEGQAFCVKDKGVKAQAAPRMVLTEGFGLY